MAATDSPGGPPTAGDHPQRDTLACADYALRHEIL